MSKWHDGPCVTQRVRSLNLTTHASLSAIWRGFAPGFVYYKKGCTRLAATSDEVFQLLAHGWWLSLGTPASSTTKTGGHGIAEILLKVALKHQKSKNLIRTTWMSPPSILRRLANVSPFFFISLSNRLRITNYCLKSLSLNSQDLFKETILPQQILIWSGIYNTCIWIRSAMPIKLDL